MISFTRAAVQEIRARIASHLADRSYANQVKLATLDSHAWAIQSGLDEGARMFGSYDENIEDLRNRVREDGAVARHLRTVEHLVVDEAQDFRGIRADLVIEMILKLSNDCGVTVFADEAQSIFRFADDQQKRLARHKEAPLPQRIRKGDAGEFKKYELDEVYRTTSRNLLRIYRDTRRKVLGGEGRTRDGLGGIRDEVCRLAHRGANYADNRALKDHDDAFILYRRRCDVLMGSSYLSRDGVLHRVLMSDLPSCIVPWIGLLLSEHISPELHRDHFRELWSHRMEGSPLATCTPEEAWNKLIRVAGRTNVVVDLKQLRQLLGRKKPPTELCVAEFGERGPIVGTIHAAKGREADTVHLMLPRLSAHDIDCEEEARVVFVGATRARTELRVGDGYKQFVRSLEGSRRGYRPLRPLRGQPRAQVEIGRDFDINALGLAGRRHFKHPDQVRTAQSRISEFANSPVRLMAQLDRDAEDAYRLRAESETECLGVLSPRVNRDLLRIADSIGARKRLPYLIPHLSARGARTLVVSPASTDEPEELHRPWASSGFLLAPLVLGYTALIFQKRHKFWSE